MTRNKVIAELGNRRVLASGHAAITIEEMMAVSENWARDWLADLRDLAGDLLRNSRWSSYQEVKSEDEDAPFDCHVYTAVGAYIVAFFTTDDVNVFLSRRAGAPTS